MIHVEQAIRRLRAAFPTFACGPDTVAIYAEKLARVAPHDVLRAADECIEQLDRFPTVGQMLERCRRPEYHEPFKALPDWKFAGGDDRNGCGGTFRTGTLADQRWERHEVLNANGVRGMPNAIYHRAEQAMRDEINATLDANAAKTRAARIARGEEA